jgi:DNA adenine methylase Dam
MTVVELDTMNGGANFWRDDVGVNAIPAVSRAKTPIKGCNWSEYQDKPISHEQHERWIAEDSFKDGITIMLGKVWHSRDKQGYYLNCIDVDNAIAIRELLTRNGKTQSIEELAKKTIVEQHRDNPNRLHFYVYTIGKPLRDKGSDMNSNPALHYIEDTPAFEVKGSSKKLSSVSPSIHKNGHKIEILGTKQVMILGDLETAEFQEHLDSICKKYGLSYNGHCDSDTKIPMTELFRAGNPTAKGHNRHERLLRMMESLLIRTRSILSLEQIKEIARSYNTDEYFVPPLSDLEFERQWKCAVDFVCKRVAEEGQYPHCNEPENEARNSNNKSQLTKMSVSQAKREKTGYLQVNGSIVGISPVYNMIRSVDLTCSQCSNSDHTEYQWPRYKPHLKETTKCSRCHTHTVILTPNYVSVVDIELQAPDMFNDLERLWVKLFEENTKDIAANETVSITGDIRVIRRNDNPGNKAETVLFADSIEYPKKQEVRLTHEDITKIQHWKAELDKQGKSPIDELVKMFAPEFIGTDYIKRSVLITCASAGIRNDEHRLPKRLRINLFMLGDPGLAKTEFLKKAIRLIPNSRYTGGQNATGLSLTAHVSKEDGGGDAMYMLRYGPIPRAKGAICAVNEFGQLPPVDHKHFLDCMDDDSFPVTKHGFDTMVEAYTTIIASANPIGGRWDDPDRIDASRIPTSLQVLDRFDIILILIENKDPEYLRRLASQKRQVAENYEKGVYDGNEEFLQKYLAHARTIQPMINKEGYDMLAEYFARIGESGVVDGLQRKFDTLLRITIAIAKLKLKNVADREDAHDTMEFYNVMLQQYKQIAPLIVKSPRDAAVEEILNVVKDLDGVPIEFAEAAHQACQRSLQIQYHLGDSLRIDRNHKLRDVLEILERNGSIEITSRMPVTLRWKVPRQQDSDLGNNIDESDESDESDVDNLHPNTKNSQYTSIDDSTTDNDRVDRKKIFESKKQESMSDRSDRSDYAVTSIQSSCPYCNILGYGISFNNTDLLEKHVIQRHPTWTAYPGQPDIEKYTRGLREKGPMCHPFLKWAGGKTQLLDRIDSVLPSSFNRYFEPFLGGGALFFFLSSVKNLLMEPWLSDINTDLIEAYIAIKFNVEEVIEILTKYKTDYERDPRRFYSLLRDEFNSGTGTKTERAAKFITLNKTCFNGLYRVNVNGKFNVPIGRYKDPNICDSINLRNVSIVLKRTKSHLNTDDYRNRLLANAQEGDFVYLDPPYRPLNNTANFTGYTNSGFSDRDQEKLANTFSELDTKGCKLLLSNSDTSLVRDLYKDFSKMTDSVSALRSINSKSTRRAGHTELLIRNYSM